MTRFRWESAASILLSLAAVTVGVVLVHREFFGTPVSATAAPASPTYVATWREIPPAGLVFGPQEAKVTVIEFGDLECPFCARFNKAVRAVRRSHPSDVSLVFVHMPLSIHRFARPAARAVECASRVGRAEALLDLLFEKQDSIGLKSWSDFAVASGVSDVDRFGRCVSEKAPVSRIEAGVALGQKLGVQATPTVIVNGWRYPIPPSEEVLTAAVDSIMAGREPFQTVRTKP